MGVVGKCCGVGEESKKCAEWSKKKTSRLSGVQDNKYATCILFISPVDYERVTSEYCVELMLPLTEHDYLKLAGVPA